MKGVAGDTLVIAYVSASLVIGYRTMAKNTSKNKEDRGSIPKLLNDDDKIDLDAANAKTWS
eukprot:13320351-Heterocapsa_arctica.AAC.1